MTTKKMTRRECFSILRESYPVDAPNYDEIIAIIDRELATLEKKNSGEKKPTATQEANQKLKNEILLAMEADTSYTISDMLKAFSCCEGLSNQKVSAIVRQMLVDKTVEKIVEKRTSYFKKL